MSEDKAIEPVAEVAQGQVVNATEIPFDQLPHEEQVRKYREAINWYKLRIRELEDDNGALAMQMAADRGLQVPKVPGQRSLDFARQEQEKYAKPREEMVSMMKTTIEDQRRQIDSLTQQIQALTNALTKK